MNKLILVLMLMVTTVALNAVEYDPTSGTGTAKAFYFKPTQDEYNCCHRGIADQMDRYRQAKEAGDLETALANALFHFQKAWLWNNAAFEYLSSQDKLLEGNLEKCRDWLEQAIKEADAEKLPRYQDQAAACKKKAAGTLKWVNGLIKQRDK